MATDQENGMTPGTATQESEEGLKSQEMLLNMGPQHPVHTACYDWC